MTHVLTALLGILLFVAPVGAQVVEYYHLDALGSVRAVTDGSGNVISRHDYLPYGDEWNLQASHNKRRFAGHERDSESGMDYFGARFYGPSSGVFTSVDPVTTFSANMVDPQRWNRYAYARGNPLVFVDPDGRKIQLVGDADDREVLLDAIRQGLSAASRSRVNEEEVDGRFYVTFEPDAQGKYEFEGPEAALRNLVSHETTIEFRLARKPTIYAFPASPGSTHGPTETGNLVVTLLDPNISYRLLPGILMSDARRGTTDAGLVTFHEFGHASNYLGLTEIVDSDRAALAAENRVRKSRDPNAATRIRHGDPTRR